MRRMSSEEDQEVFEITDFTTASDWERFIARIEEIIHEWKLPLQRPVHPLKKGELTSERWVEKREQLMFTSFQFEAVHHYLAKNAEGIEKETTPEEDEGEPMPYCLSDMMSRENDFPPKAHCLVRWYGIRDFVIIRPSKISDAIMTEDRTKMLLSSTCIAVNNTSCQVPVFVQLQQMRQKYFLGVCEGGGIRTNFDMVHLYRTLPQYSHLSGLLSLFKSKLACSALDIPAVIISVRFTYVLQDWSPYSWPQPPPDIDELGEDVTPTDIGRLPCGAMEDPILEFHLSTTWPCLSEDIIIDNDVHSDLNPLLAPKWAVRMRTSERPSCSMAEYLKEFATLSQGHESVDQLLGKIIADSDDSDNPHITQALDKLTQPPHSLSIPSLSSIMSHTRSHYPESQDSLLISEEVLIKILQFIFPDSAPTPNEQENDEWKDTVGSVSDLKNTVAFAKVQEHMRAFKSAPPGSLTWRLALAMCQVNHSYGGLQAVAQLWQDFLLEMRHRWENNYTLPCLDPGPPNMTFCLLHQKLQMLNCCIQRKKAREWQQINQNEDIIEDGNEQHSSVYGSESDEEEFFECAENSSSSSDSKGENSKKKHIEGRLRQLGNLTVLNSDQPLYIPITQEPAPVTEDLLEEQAEVLVQLGTHPEGAALRARMQSACLMSDMEAFKAANPNSVLEDFVKWYSPRDLVEEETVDEVTGNKIMQGRLSARMLLPGNMWLEAWESARPVPARRQKRLFDDTKEAEKVLHFLASLRTTDVVKHLMPMLVHCALLQLAEEDECPQSLPIKLEETAIKAAKAMRNVHPKYDDILHCLYQAEVITAQIQSLRSKFSLIDNEDESQGEPSSYENTFSNVNRSLLEQSEEFDIKKGSNRLWKKEALGTIPEAENKICSEEADISKFVLDLLDNYEVEIPGGGKGVIGRRIRHLFSEAQRASHLILDEKPLSSGSERGKRYHPTVPEFPPPSGKEFILRTTISRPASYSTPSPQRMYCVLTREEFRLAGAFSEDTTFY